MRSNLQNMPQAFVGREAELAAIRGLLARPNAVVHPVVVPVVVPVLVTGPIGIGKSALLDAVAEEHAARGIAVLRGSPVESDRRLAHSTLVDLLADLDHDLFDALSGRRRAAVDAALIRTGSAARCGGDVLALRLGVLDLLGALAELQPVLLVLDDAQWVDRPSAETLAFVIRRLHGRPVSTVLAVDRWPLPPRAPQVCAAPVARVPVGPLNPADLDLMVTSHLGLRSESRHSARLHAASGGNPRLAIELASTQDGALPPGARDLLDRQLAQLTRPARSALLFAALAAEPSVPLLERAGLPTAGDSLREAAEHGLVELDAAGAVRFTATALADLLRHEAPGAEQRAAHARLARAVADPVERSRHRAMASTAADQDLAAALDDAAATARRRGARSAAAELSWLAAERTPPGQPDAAVLRMVAAAVDAAAAGDLDRVGRAVRAVYTRTEAPTARVGALLALIDASGQDLDGQDAAFARVVLDAGGDPALLAKVHCRLAVRANLAGAPARARDLAAQAAALAVVAGDRTAEALALTLTARMQRVLGDPVARLTLDAALAVPTPPGTVPLHCGPRYVHARLAFFDDHLEEARTELFALLAEAERDGGVEGIVELSRSVAELDAKAGRCTEAAHYAHRAYRMSQEHGLSAGPACYTMAAVCVAAGSFVEAIGYARHGSQVAEHEHDRIYLSRNLCVLGMAQVATEDVADALSALLAVRDLETGQGCVDPSMLCWQAELAGALARSRRTAEAAELGERTAATAERLGQPGVLAQLDRAAAVRHVVCDELDAAAALLRDAGERFTALGLPIEQARTALFLGRVERRRRHHPAARAALHGAYQTFDSCGATAWLPLVNRQLAELDGAGAGASAGVGASDAARQHPLLTSAEWEVASRAARGTSNREIAAQLFLSVKTVEAMLTSTYRKLGIRSRTALAVNL